jgi:hypothetical protein
MSILTWNSVQTPLQNPTLTNRSPALIPDLQSFRINALLVFLIKTSRLWCCIVLCGIQKDCIPLKHCYTSTKIWHHIPEDHKLNTSKIKHDNLSCLPDLIWVQTWRLEPPIICSSQVTKMLPSSALVNSHCLEFFTMYWVFKLPYSFGLRFM